MSTDVQKDRKKAFTSAALAIRMVVMLGIANNMKPNIYLAEQRLFLEDVDSMIPSSFGKWKEEKSRELSVINPQQVELINRIYAKVINRTYRNEDGQRIMLSIAYGRDQRSDMAVHYPEVCYPAQGFTVTELTRDSLEVVDRRLNVKRMNANMGSMRNEPVTYWVTIGDHAGVEGFQRRLIEFRYGVKRIIPDGLLFRVSSIGNKPMVEYRAHDRFITDILASVPEDVRDFFSGKPENYRR